MRPTCDASSSPVAVVLKERSSQSLTCVDAAVTLSALPPACHHVDTSSMSVYASYGAALSKSCAIALSVSAHCQASQWTRDCVMSPSVVIIQVVDCVLVYSQCHTSVADCHVCDRHVSCASACRHRCSRSVTSAHVEAHRDMSIADCLMRQNMRLFKS